MHVLTDFQLQYREMIIAFSPSLNECFVLRNLEIFGKSSGNNITITNIVSKRLMCGVSLGEFFWDYGTEFIELPSISNAKTLDIYKNDKIKILWIAYFCCESCVNMICGNSKGVLDAAENNKGLVRAKSQDKNSRIQ